MEVSSLQTHNQDLNADNQLFKGSLSISESQDKPMKVESDNLNKTKEKIDEIHERQEFAALVPLIKAEEEKRLNLIE